VAITPDGALAYVVIEIEDDGMPGNRGSVRVIDTATGMVVGAPILLGDRPLGIAITPDGERAYVTNIGDGSVSVIDVASSSVIGSPIAVGPWPAAIVFVPEVP
jgi:YVTN family beta-propeller protein